jgi:hypothetical protein
MDGRRQRFVVAHHVRSQRERRRQRRLFGGREHVDVLAGTLTVAGQTFTVTQAGAPACTSTINPTSANFTRDGGTRTVSITIPDGCAWTAQSNASWITINPSSGSGNGTVSYSVGPYGGPPKNRTGTVTIAGKTFTVKQTK